MIHAGALVARGLTRQPEKGQHRIKCHRIAICVEIEVNTHINIVMVVCYPRRAEWRRRSQIFHKKMIAAK